MCETYSVKLAEQLLIKADTYTGHVLAITRDPSSSNQLGDAQGADTWARMVIDTVMGVWEPHKLCMGVKGWVMTNAPGAPGLEGSQHTAPRSDCLMSLWADSSELGAGYSGYIAHGAIGTRVVLHGLYLHWSSREGVYHTNI